MAIDKALYQAPMGIDAADARSSWTRTVESTRSAVDAAVDSDSLVSCFSSEGVARVHRARHGWRRPKGSEPSGHMRKAGVLGPDAIAHSHSPMQTHAHPASTILTACIRSTSAVAITNSHGAASTQQLLTRSLTHPHTLLLT